MRLCNTILGVLFLAGLDFSDCLQTMVRADKGSSVTVFTDLDCLVCTYSGVNDTEVSCSTLVTLVPEVDVKLLFNCSQPVEKAYTAAIARSVVCTEDACSPTTVEAQSSTLTFLPRVFSWDLMAPEKTVVSLNVLGDGLVEKPQPCSDGIQYSVAASQTNSQYCRGGSVTRLDLLTPAAVTLRAGPEAAVDGVLFQASAGPLKGRSMVVTIDSSTAVELKRVLQEPECEICTTTTAGTSTDCSSKGMTLAQEQNLSLEFSCLKPEDIYTVTIRRTISCTDNSCTPAAAGVDPTLFQDFKRSLVWDVGVPDRTVLNLDFPADGLREIAPAESCDDGYQYSVRKTKSDGGFQTTSYCRGGTVSHLDLLKATTVTFDLPKGGDTDKAVFNAKTTPRAGRMMSVTPDPDTTITIRRVTEEPDCDVCTGLKPHQECSRTFKKLMEPRNTSVEFTCPQPEDVFTVEITRDIDCTETSCSGDIVQAETSLFTGYNRTFVWYLKVVSTRAFQLEFPEPGMRQIPNEDTCPDEHTYSLLIYLRTGPATVGTFCKGGPVTSILGRYKGQMTLKVPGVGKVNPVDFKLNVGPETDEMAIVKVQLPRGVSDTELITPNYSGDLPNQEQMRWDFAVPGMHNYTVLFLDHTEPECLAGNVAVEYRRVDKDVTKLTLTDPQPEHQQGSFNMVLKNCKTNTTLQGLTLRYKVSLMRSGHPVLCTVDLTKSSGVSVQLEMVGSDPYCEMSLDSLVEKQIRVAAGTTAKLSFLDCPAEDVRLTASQLISCQNAAACPSAALTVPSLPSCLRMPLHSFTWHVNIPQNATVDLLSPTGTLKQSLPGQKCRKPLHVAEGDGFPVGDFCFNGTIQKVQVHANVSITAKALDFNKTKGPFLNVSVSEEIPETIIYRIIPKLKSPTLLATPNWPQGMKPFSTIAWIVEMPSQYKALLQFNVSQPKCADRHTAIKVKMLGYEEEMMSRREDEEAEDLPVPNSFYLNMSNCIPEEGNFSAVTKITLEKKINLLAILLGIAAVLLVLLVVLAVVLVLKKKKDDKKRKEASIYISKGVAFRPGDMHFSKARSDNESHVYDSIDEMMVYGHLLTGDDSMQDGYNGKQPDTYRTFTGPADAALPVISEPEPKPEVDGFNTFLDPASSFMPPRPRTPISRQDSLGFQDSRMVDNELYTFKSLGDMNTIRLSAADLEPEGPTDDYL